MRFRFRSKKLEALYTEEKGAQRYPAAVVEAFFRAMATIAAAVDERDLYAFKGRRYEKLRGDRAGQHSLRLNDQFRLIVEWEEDDQGRCLVVVEIEEGVPWVGS